MRRIRWSRCADRDACLHRPFCCSEVSTELAVKFPPKIFVAHQDGRRLGRPPDALPMGHDKIRPLRDRKRHLIPNPRLSRLSRPNALALPKQDISLGSVRRDNPRLVDS